MLAVRAFVFVDYVTGSRELSIQYKLSQFILEVILTGVIKS